jgi:hypothetical protein
MFALARSADVVLEELPDELLVYDLKRHRAHCLNRAAAAVFRACDGRRDLAALVAEAQKTLGPDADEELVHAALEELSRARLIEHAPARPVSRRKVLRALALAPAVLSILAPRAAQAASCGGRGSSCTKRSDCCPGLNCVGTGHKLCM